MNTATIAALEGAYAKANRGLLELSDLILLAASLDVEPMAAAKHMRAAGIVAGGEESYARQITKARAAQVPAKNSTWEQPTAFDDIGCLPSFPLDALPQTLRAWVEAEAIATQTPPELAATIALGVISAVTAKHFEVQVKDGWVEPLSFYAFAAMNPGERKSQVFRDACKKIREWETDKANSMKAMIAAEVTKRTILEKRLDVEMNKAAKGGNDAASAGQKAQELAIELAQTFIPVAPLVSIDDVTPEKLGSLMYEHGGRMAIMSAEGGIFDTMAGRYSDGVANIDTLLKGHAGDDLRVDRVNRAPLHIQKPALTMCICAQPEVIQGLTSKPTFRGRGLLARFMYVMPTSLMGRRDVSPPTLPATVAADYADLVGKLLRDRKPQEQREIESRVIELTPDALGAVEAFMKRLEPRLGPGGDLEQINDWAAKATGAMVRIAGLLHLAGGFESFESFERGRVTRREVDESEKILLFFLSHSLAAFRVMGMDASISQARKLLNWIQKGQLTRFTRREAHQKHRATFKKADEIDPALRVLEEHGHIRPLANESTGGRPASPTYEVNPLAQKPQKPQKSLLH
jgi:hypothetical protein